MQGADGATSIGSFSYGESRVIEEWRPIPGYEGYYEVSNMGRVKSLNRYTQSRWGTPIFHKSQMMKCRVASNGYRHVKLTKEGRCKEPLVHRLVAEAFLTNPLNLPQVNHKDGNKSNDVVSNLEWCSQSENQLHSRRVLKRVCGLPRKPVECIDTGEVFETAHHAARAYGLRPAGVYYVCEGRNTHAGGMHFKYVN